jgi:hypothetical protein
MPSAERRKTGPLTVAALRTIERSSPRSAREATGATEPPEAGFVSPVPLSAS